MNQALRWMLILGCLMLAVLEAPRSSALVVEDLAGPYPEPQLSQAQPARPAVLPRFAGAPPARSEILLAGAETK